MARFDLLVSRLPTQAQPRVLQLARRRRELDEAALASLFANPDAPETRVAVLNSGAAAEALQAELEELGCSAVVVEHPSLLGELLARLRRQPTPPPPTATTPVAATGRATSPTPTGGMAAATGFRRLYGSTRDEIEQAERRRRWLIQAAVGLVFALVVAGLAAWLTRSLASPPPDTLNPPERAADPVARPAVDGGAQSTDQQGQTSGSDTPGPEAASPPVADEVEPAVQPSGPGSGDSSGRGAAPSAPAPPAARPEDDPASTGDRPARTVVLIVVGFASALLALWLLRRVAPPARADWVERVAAIAIGTVSTAVLIVSAASAPGPSTAAARAGTAADPSAGAQPGDTAATHAPSGPSEASGAPALDPHDAAATPTIAAFVAALRRPAEPADARPFGAMAAAVAARGSGGDAGDGSGDGQQAGEASGQGPRPTMAGFVETLWSPAAPCPSPDSAPFAAMQCNLARRPGHDAGDAAEGSGEPVAGTDAATADGSGQGPSAPDAERPTGAAAGEPPSEPGSSRQAQPLDDGSGSTRPSRASTAADGAPPAAPGGSSEPTEHRGSRDPSTPQVRPAPDPAPSRSAQAGALALGALIGAIVDLLTVIARRLRTLETP